MSVLVKGMDMPDNCELCAFESEFGFCLAKSDNFSGYTSDRKRPEWCPLVEVPEPHGRLIDGDAVMKQWGLDKATKYGNKTSKQQHFSYSTMMMYEIADIFNDAPTVIEQEDE